MVLLRFLVICFVVIFLVENLEDEDDDTEGEKE